MKLEADFTKISTEYVPPVAGDYPMVIEDIEEGKTNSGLPQLVFTNKITGGGEYDGRTIKDFVVLQTKQGKVNEIGYGRVKAYAEAILGKESANGGELNTEDLKGGAFTGVLKDDSYEKEGETKKTVRLVKILPQ